MSGMAGSAWAYRLAVSLASDADVLKAGHVTGWIRGQCSACATDIRPNRLSRHGAAGAV